MPKEKSPFIAYSNSIEHNARMMKKKNGKRSRMYVSISPGTETDKFSTFEGKYPLFNRIEL